jgi:choline dehydrogenase-like flavoprotein
MGDNRETNVVDRYGFAHEVSNLSLLDASVMGSSGAHNPTLTAQALAWRGGASGAELGDACEVRGVGGEGAADPSSRRRPEMRPAWRSLKGWGP